MAIFSRTAVVLCSLLFALPLLGAQGTLIGGAPYEKWEEGGNDFFVMFNSLIDDQRTLSGESTNRQGDTCIEQSSFDLNIIHTPKDALVIKAYLVWMGAVDPTKFNDPTDNAVHLKFSRSDGYTYEEDIIAGDTPRMLGDTSNEFEFQSVKFTSDVSVGCSETNPGTKVNREVAYFTYRKDITPFFQKIFDDNRTSETPLLDGVALHGTYTVSGLDCTSDEIYLCNTTMVSNWSILIVYKSQEIHAKKIYFYPGFAWSQGETTMATVSGFELPRKPIVRVMTMIAEGDPSLVKATLPPELIYIRGPNATSNYLLTNECNPYVNETMSYEVYNSNSSLYGWDPDDVELMCVTGVTGGPNYFGVDADTFLLDSEDDVNLQEHLTLGGTSLNVTLSVNQDAILTNYLLVSIDTKTPAFDIPEEATPWPHGREKHFCSCRKNEDYEDSFCAERPMYYLIKVQNWGTNDAMNVVVIDDLPTQYVTYVPGTTKMTSKFDENGNGICWQDIPDKAGNDADPNSKFPLSGEGYKVADKMEVCNQTTLYCKDTRLIRFKVVPKPNLPKHTGIPNHALIKEQGSSEAYYTNTNFDLNLRFGTCIEAAVCPEPDLLNCYAGVDNPDDPECGAPPECTKDEDCQPGYVCDTKTDVQYSENDFKCKPDKTQTCLNATITYEKGGNSPDNVASPIIVPAGAQNVLLGQFRIRADNCDQSKYYSFVSLHLKVDKKDTKVMVSDLKLVYDRNANGIFDADEEVVGTPVSSTGSVEYFVIDKSKNRFAGKQWHYFIVLGTPGYTTTQVPNAATFNLLIENKSSFSFADAGEPYVDGEPLPFATFQIEPTANYFIVTKGMNDPKVPSLDQLRQDIPMLQIRTKAMDAPNKVMRIVVSTANDSTLFGGKGGIRAVSLYLDTNGDGLPDGEPIARATSFDDPTMVTFEGDTISSLLDYDTGEEIFLIVNCDLSSVPEATLSATGVQIMVRKGGVVVQNTTKRVEGLPVYSKVFNTSIPQSDGDIVEPKSDGCGCSVVGW